MRRLHALLRRWPLIPFKYALQLLDYAYPDERVHEFAVKCLNVEEDETIEMFFCQLVQALKHQNYYNSALCSFLLERALKNQRLGHKVWSVAASMGCPGYPWISQIFQCFRIRQHIVTKSGDIL